jgi:transposase-like protein
MSVARKVRRTRGNRNPRQNFRKNNRSFGYFSEKCPACGTHNNRLERERSETEIYLEIYTCISCGYGIPENYEAPLERSSKNKVSVKYVDQYSLGYEIEFCIKDGAHDSAFVKQMQGDPLYTHYGFDGIGGFIKEYRSPVFVGETHKEVAELVLQDLRVALNQIERFGGKLVPFVVKGLYVLPLGIHISFGGNFLPSARFSNEYWLQNGILGNLHKRVPFRLERIFIEKLRFHRDRFEYRGLASSPNSIRVVEEFLKSL